ncbi:MAG: aldehyde dehydrogenase family protein, partial [Aquiluna sp.]
METLESLLAAIAPKGASREIYNPATGELVGHAPVQTEAEADDAVERAKKAQKSWALLGHAKRSEILLKAADAIDENAEALAQLLSREQGKPLNGPNARFEIGGASAWLRTAATTKLDTEVVVDDETGHAEITYKPIGVVAAIGPWNWPVMITVWQVAPALRMGNTVVVKPSEYTPLSVLALIHVMNSVLPADVLIPVAGGREVGARLSSHPAIGKVMFTGSTATGKAIIRSSAVTVKRLTLE